MDFSMNDFEQVRELLITHELYNDELNHSIEEIRKLLPTFVANYQDNNVTIKIYQSFQNLTKFNFENSSEPEKKLYQECCRKVFQSVTTFTTFMLSNANESAKSIELKLFNLIFSPSDDFNCRVYPLYQIHDEFLTTQDPFLNLKSSTGSGKTRCSPFFFALRALLENMEHPYFIMTQPGTSMIKDKLTDFEELLGDSVIFETSISGMLTLFQQQPEKPVIGLFSPHNALKLLIQALDANLPIISKTRFVLDEIHERHVNVDVLIAKLSELTYEPENQFPFQVLMMSATPDPRVLHCFSKEVKLLNLADSQLFPIEDIKVVADTLDDLNNVAVEHTYNILSKMIRNEISPGHILIFTSGNARINKIIKSLPSAQSKYLPGSHLTFITNLDNYRNDRTIFYNKLNEIIGGDQKTLFFLPIKYAGFITQEAKEIGKNPIPGHPNVIKIIVATNSIESSITIDGLAAVIDTGIHNQPSYDVSRGLTTLTEGPISKQSQTQRRGRVGRIRNGICVQITLKDNPPIELLPPAILSTDLSSNILDLRLMNIRLESITNLPDQIAPSVIDAMIQKLVEYQALDSKDHNLTQVGRTLSKFTNISPYISTSIINVVQKYENQNLNLLYYLGALTVMVFSTDIVANPSSEQFQKNFDENSDVITIMKTLLDVISLHKSFKATLQNYGFQDKNASQVINTIQQIMQNFDKDTDTNTLWDQLISLYKTMDMMQFIQSIIEEIGKTRPEWIKCRVASYRTVINVLNKYALLYKGDTSLSYDGKLSFIEVSQRPGAKGFTCPGSCFVLQIRQNIDMKKNFGSVVHRDLSRKETEHPIAILTDLFLNNIFTIPLIEVFVQSGGMYEPFHKKFYKTQPSNLLICFTSQYQDKTALSFVPKNPHSTRLMEEAIEQVKQLLPYTPRCILVRNDLLQCAIAAYSDGTDKISTDVYFYSEKSPYCYTLNNQMLSYLISHKDELRSIDAHLMIAVTGEKFTYTLDGRDVYDATPLTPNLNLKDNFVFSDDHNLWCHLVVISKNQIPQFRYIRWTNSSRFVNSLSRQPKDQPPQNNKLMLAIHQKPRLLTTVSQPLKMIYVEGESSNVDIQQSIKVKNMTSLFEYLETNYFNEGKCISNLPTSFSFNSGNEIQPICKIVSMNRDLRNVPQNEIERFISLQTDIDRVKNELERLNEEISSATEENLATLNKRKTQLQTELDQLNRQTNGFRNIPRSCKNSQIKDAYNNAQPIFKEEEVLSISHTNNQLILSVESDTSLDNIKQAIDKVAHSPYQLEIIPVFEIVVHHFEFLNLTRDQFLRKVDDVIMKFGLVVKYSGHYIHEHDKPMILGSIRVNVYTNNFTSLFVNELISAFSSATESTLIIPRSIVPFSMLNNRLTIEAIQHWLHDNHFNHVVHRNNRWIGPIFEVAQAQELILTKNNRPDFPFVIHTLPGGINIDSAINYIQEQRLEWTIEKMTRRVICPKSVTEDEFNQFISLPQFTNPIKSDDDILGDYALMCEEAAIRSGHLINIYHKNNQVTMQNYCVTCVYSLMSNVMERLFDEEAGIPHMELLFENMENINPISLIECHEERGEIWPVIPLGQMMWAFVDEPTINAVSRTWLTALVVHALHKSMKFTFCPSHPAYLYPFKEYSQDLHCCEPGCRLLLCSDCHKWHVQDKCTIEKPKAPPGMRVCPACKFVVEKSRDCNHLECRCGHHFCYYCGYGPTDDGSEIYSHLDEVHGGYFNDPPDYRKFILHENISDAELVEFYSKYPHLKP